MQELWIEGAHDWGDGWVLVPRPTRQRPTDPAPFPSAPPTAYTCIWRRDTR